jgi:hippurate hydrolase
MLRADMDGLPVEEETGLAYASTARQEDIDGVEQPVMHACGHDVHVTALIGAADMLAGRREQWSGTLVLIGQPAEQRIIGAQQMMEDGLYARFPKPDYALAFHVSAGQPSGTIQLVPGIAYSSSDSVDIVVHGVGAHGASPHKGIDPVLVAAQIVVSLQSLVSRSIPPQHPGVITVGAIHGGSKHNIIGERVELQLTVRSDSTATRQTLLDGIDRVAEGVARSLGVPEDRLPEVIRSQESTPPTVNDAALASKLREVFEDHFGEPRIYDEPREGMGAEDFAYFVQPDTGVKGANFSIGGTPPGDVESAPSHHSPIFEIEPRPSVTAGIEALVVGALALMAD